jgi:hypothetical protein
MMPLLMPVRLFRHDCFGSSIRRYLDLVFPAVPPFPLLVECAAQEDSDEVELLV